MEKSFQLISETGLHARPATNFVRYISSLPIDVFLIYKDFVADAKSIMAIMSLGLSKDDTFILRVADEHSQYLKEIESYMKEHQLI
jgi:phosphocarrier protein